MNVDDIENKLISILNERNYSITTAESCTGGLLAAKLVGVEGASEVFKEGHITYANAAKEKYLKVSTETLNTYGAVSRQTADEMAYGAAKLADADMALSVTGFAGPSGGDDENPVGTVYIGCYLKGATDVERHIFTGNRQEIREAAVCNALKLAYDCLKKEL